MDPSTTKSSECHHQRQSSSSTTDCFGFRKSSSSFGSVIYYCLAGWMVVLLLGPGLPRSHGFGPLQRLAGRRPLCLQFSWTARWPLIQTCQWLEEVNCHRRQKSVATFVRFQTHYHHHHHGAIHNSPKSVRLSSSVSLSSGHVQDMPETEQELIHGPALPMGGSFRYGCLVRNLQAEAKSDPEEDESDVNDGNDETEHLWMDQLPQGLKSEFRVVKYYCLPPKSFDSFFDPQQQLHQDHGSFNGAKLESANTSLDVKDTDTGAEHKNKSTASSSSAIRSIMSENDIGRLELSRSNLTLPVLLMLLDPLEFPSLSRARKACRKGNILVHRGPLHSTTNNRTNDDDDESSLGETLPLFNQSNCEVGRVGDRLFPGDVIAKQIRMGSGYFPVLAYKQPPFEVPVVYQDDSWAMVNKPAGVVVYAHKNGGHGTMTLRAALPFVLDPPRYGTYSVIRRPASVHRLDKPTSGIVCVAKTKPALLHLSRQFHDRIVQKTYMAIVNGIPLENKDLQVSSHEAFHTYGVDVDPTATDQYWNVIDQPLEERSALTLWRAVRYVPSLHGTDGYLTLVELKPKTGRFHQLRRHMSWYAHCPLVGDDVYDGGTRSALKFRERGLFLCATRITLQHPYYNTLPEGRQAWDQLWQAQSFETPPNESTPMTFRKSQDDDTASSVTQLWYCSQTDKVLVRAEIELPRKFYHFMDHEQARHEKFSTRSQDEERDDKQVCNP